jgi:hypothetical protein
MCTGMHISAAVVWPVAALMHAACGLMCVAVMLPWVWLALALVSG